ncbi:MAG: hypothetical protein E2O29_02095 [Deltaproteobacteria bacterium]|nr:MAG: hypothetical protein E2O29_02095 [Deltaproteobacteria bacterium]
MPASATDNGDGTASLDVSGGGGGGVDPVGLKNIAAAIINPATDDTLLLIDGKLATLLTTDFSTETTLAALLAVDFATETTLATRASETTLATRASETTLATRASEVTLATRATEITLAAIKAQTDKLIFTGDDLKVVDSAGGAGTAGVAEHHNGTATTTPANVTFTGTSKAILIDNLDASNNLLVSFDGGANTKTVLPGQSLSIEANHSAVAVSSSAATVPFEMLVTV